MCVCVYYCSTYYKAVRVGGGGNNGGHVLRETTSRSLCGLDCPSRTSERRGKEDPSSSTHFVPNSLSVGLTGPSSTLDRPTLSKWWRTVLPFHTISARPSKQPRMVGSTLGVDSFGLIFVSARIKKRHHHYQEA